MTSAYTEIDWMQCELIEQVPGKVSGRPIVRGTRIVPDAVVDSFDLGEASTNFAKDFRRCQSPKSSALSTLPTPSESTPTREGFAR